jgi:hypothetical protein
MKKLFKSILKSIISISSFLITSTIILYLAWQWFGKEHISRNLPVGGDYFNALTYVNFFHKNLTLPPSGWLPFWHEGSPVVGGYPWFAFYLMQPLTRLFDIATSMEVFSVTMILAYLFFSLLLFWQVSKSASLALGLSLVTLTTKATFYQLTTVGTIVSSSAQFYLPLTFLLIYRFTETKKNFYLILASVSSGLSLLHHAPTGVIVVALPALALLILAKQSNTTFKKKLLYLLVFSTITLAIGSMGVYGLLRQALLAYGSGQCQTARCWGIYPDHLQLWMNPISLFILTALLLLTAPLKLFGKPLRFSTIIPAAAALVVIIIYAAAAWLKLINSLSLVFFPTRTFWAANTLTLLLTASLFREIRRGLHKFSYVLAPVILLAIVFVTLNRPFSVNTDRSDTVPPEVAAYTVSKYQKYPLSDLVPEWIPITDTNRRLDTFNYGLDHWWNVISQMPATRGHSNHPVGEQQNWQYYLQAVTRDPKGENQELVKNKALFLIDAYAINFRENSIATFPISIMNDPQIIIKKNAKQYRDFTWYQISPEYTTPIVYPSNSKPMLFIGDDLGYDNFIRSISMTNLNSRFIIPVKGPESINAITYEDLENFEAIILYRFQGDKWNKVTTFLENAGSMFIESGSLETNLPTLLPEFFPVNSFTSNEIKGQWNPQTHSETTLSQNVNTNEFSPLNFEGTPWKISSSTISDLQDWAKPLLSSEEKLIIAGGEFSGGIVIWSGMNLPYHVVSNNNLEEAKLFKNIIVSLTDISTKKLTSDVKRLSPTKISVSGENFSGVYFKENYHSGWKARVNNTKVPIFKAGLGFMYIPIPKNQQNQPLEVSIFFAGNLTAWLLFYLTLASLFACILYFIYPKLFVSILTNLKRRVQKK